MLQSGRNRKGERERERERLNTKAGGGGGQVINARRETGIKILSLTAQFIRALHIVLWTPRGFAFLTLCVFF
jgi:hypothetical protein